MNKNDAKFAKPNKKIVYFFSFLLHSIILYVYTLLNINKSAIYMIRYDEIIMKGNVVCNIRIHMCNHMKPKNYSNTYVGTYVYIDKYKAHHL